MENFKSKLFASSFFWKIIEQSTEILSWQQVNILTTESSIYHFFSWTNVSVFLSFPFLQVSRILNSEDHALVSLLNTQALINEQGRIFQKFDIQAGSNKRAGRNFHIIITNEQALINKQGGIFQKFDKRAGFINQAWWNFHIIIINE